MSAIAGFFARFVVHVAGSALFLLGVLALLWREDWRIGAVLTVFAVAALAFMTRGGGFVGRSARDARQASADLSAFLEERLVGLPDIKANGADSYTMRRLHERLRARFLTGRRSILAASRVLQHGRTSLFVAGAGASRWRSACCSTGRARSRSAPCSSSSATRPCCASRSSGCRAT